MQLLYKIVMFIPSKIASLLSIVFGFIGRIIRILLIVGGSIFALGAVIIFISGSGGNFIGIGLLILSLACFFGQRVSAIFQKGIFTMKNWFSSKM